MLPLGIVQYSSAFLCNCRQASSPYAKSASMWCIHTAVLTRPLLGKKLRFILSDRYDFHMTDSLSIAIHAFATCVLMSFLVDKTLLPRKVNLFTSFRDIPFSVEISLLWLKHINSVLFALTWRLMPPAACSRLCSRDSTWVGVFTRSAMSSA